MPSASGRKKPLYLRRQQHIAYLFVLPPMLLFCVFTLIPTVMAFGLSFTKYDFVKAPTFVGLSNFSKLLHDQFFWSFLRNTVQYVLMYVPLGFAAALGTALLLNRAAKGIAIFRTAFYLPVLSSTVATATIWLWILNAQNGVVNTLLRSVGLSVVPWLNDTRYAMLSVVIMSVWAGFGANMMILLAGLKGVPEHLYESAQLDGANAWQRFLYITIPSISSTIFFVTTMLLIQSFQMFDQAFILTEGGPGNATKTMVYYIYTTAFSRLNMGYASALSVALFLMIFIFSLFNMRANRSSQDFA